MSPCQSFSIICNTYELKRRFIMPLYQYIKPTDQPSGKFRLIDWLDKNFQNTNYTHFYCLAAFAKINPFYKLHTSIQDWNSRGNTSAAVFGIDHKGTSLQALQYALANFDKVQILHVNYSTFHPKLYIFLGTTKASIYYGSSNFTSGGLETNFEGGMIVDFDIPKEQLQFDELFDCYNSIAASGLSCITKLTPSFLNTLNTSGFLLDETKRSKSSTTMTPASTSSSHTSLFGGFKIKPARSIPKNVITMAAASAGIVMPPVKKASPPIALSPLVSRPVPASPVVVPVVINGFVIQIVPHHNGEILLSKVAINQNPTFFGFPFTGATTSKKSGNPSYPQRVPDPIVNIRVFDSKGNLIKTELNYALNTIYYTKKSEIRITITPSILSGLTAPANSYPLLVMRESTIIGCDYDLDFYSAGSIDYNNYLAICNQSLPSGGKSIARRMGWI